MKLQKRLTKSSLFRKIIVYILFAYLKCVQYTSKVVIVNKPADIDEIQSSRFIYALWHGHLGYLFFHSPSNFMKYALITPHSDGQIISKLAGLYKTKTIFGSSFSNPFKAVRGILNILKKDATLIITPDGPRGPPHEINSSIVDIATKTNTPILPIAYHSKRYLQFGSWDKFHLSLPFNTIYVSYGEPIEPSVRNNDTLLKERINNALTKVLNV